MYADVIDHTSHSYALRAFFVYDCSYDVMMRCWNHIPDERPLFGELVVSLNILLEEVAGYLDFSALSRANGGQAGGREGYDHLPKRDTDDVRYDHLMEND